MHGIPVLIKDNIDTADRMMTTAGSLALVGSKPAKDSFVAQKLRAAGAVFLGKTSTSSEVGKYSFEPFDQRLERARRAYQESLCTRPESLWIEFGHRCRRFGEPGGGGDWHRDRWVRLFVRRLRMAWPELNRQ